MFLLMYLLTYLHVPLCHQAHHRKPQYSSKNDTPCATHWPPCPWSAKIYFERNPIQLRHRRNDTRCPNSFPSRSRHTEELYFTEMETFSKTEFYEKNSPRKFVCFNKKWRNKT